MADKDRDDKGGKVGSIILATLKRIERKQDRILAALGEADDDEEEIDG